MGLSVNLQKYNLIAQCPDPNQRIVLGFGASVTRGEADAGLRGRHITCKGGTSQATENRDVRQQFLNAVLKECGAKTFRDLPASVRKAFNVKIGKDDLKLDANGLVTSTKPLTSRRIRAVLTAVSEVNDAVNRDIGNFENVDGERTVKDFIDDRCGKSISSLAKNEFEVWKNLHEFEKLAGFTMTPDERSLCFRNVSGRTDLIREKTGNNAKCNKFDLSDPANQESLRERIAELRSGECHGASDKAMRTLSILMFADPTLKACDAKRILLLAKQCRDAGIGKLCNAGMDQPVQRLREISSAIGMATYREFGTWLAQASAKADGHFKEEEIARMDYMAANTVYNDDSHMIASMLMKVLLAESDGLGDILRNITQKDIVNLKAEKQIEDARNLGEPKTEEQKRLSELMRNDELDEMQIAIDKAKTPEEKRTLMLKRDTRMAEIDKARTSEEREEISVLSQLEVSRFIDETLMKEFVSEAMSHFDFDEIEKQVYQYLNENVNYKVSI